MLAADRQRWIMECVERDSSVRVVKLAKELSVSGETVRRDLEFLEHQGLVRRVYGGAVAVLEARDTARAYQEREQYRKEEKEAIGKLAAMLLDRITHRAHILLMNGDSYRFRQSLQRQHEEQEET